MIVITIYDQGKQFRVHQVDDETRERRDVSASYLGMETKIVGPDGRTFAGFFVGEAVGQAEAAPAVVPRLPQPLHVKRSRQWGQPRRAKRKLMREIAMEMAKERAP